MIHQDAKLYAAILNGDTKLEHPIAPGRTAYLHLIRGTLEVNGKLLKTGDALKFSKEAGVVISHAEAAEFLLFDLPY